MDEIMTAGLLCIQSRVNSSSSLRQLSFLGGFKKWLLNLQMGSVPPTKSSGLFIEAVAEIREGLIKR